MRSQYSIAQMFRVECSRAIKLLIPIVIALAVVGCGPEPSIHEAAAGGNIKRVKQHLIEGVDVNAKYKDGWTPLHMAAEGGHREIVDLLIAKGAVEDFG